MYCKEDNRHCYSLTDANFITGVSIPTLRRRIADGDLEAYQPNGGKWRIEANELINYAWWEWGRLNETGVAMNPPQLWQGRMDFIDNK